MNPNALACAHVHAKKAAHVECVVVVVVVFVVVRTVVNRQVMMVMRMVGVCGPVQGYAVTQILRRR